jgi:predicted outer membrane protein
VSAEFAVALPAVLAVVAVLLAGFKIANAGAGDIRALTSYAVAASRGESQELLDDWAKKHLSDYRVTFYIEASSLCATAKSTTGVARSLKRCVWVGDY